MFTLLKTATVVAVLGLAAPAQARPFNISITMDSYRGQEAYLAAYIVDANGQYVSTVLTAGTRSRYLADLSRWNRMFQRAGGRVDGFSGASIGSGQSIRTQIDVPDALLNAGYTLRIETAVEDKRYQPDEAAVLLADVNNGQHISGSGYVRTVTVSY